MLCRVILGKMEQISEGSKQFHPSSEEFDSGVDNLADPRRYIIWSSYMNSHILPTFIVSFKAFTSAGEQSSALVGLNWNLNFEDRALNFKF